MDVAPPKFYQVKQLWSIKIEHSFDKTEGTHMILLEQLKSLFPVKTFEFPIHFTPLSKMLLPLDTFYILFTLNPYIHNIQLLSK